MSEYDTNNTNTMIGRCTSHVMEAYTMFRKCQARDKDAQAPASLHPRSQLTDLALVIGCMQLMPQKLIKLVQKISLFGIVALNQKIF